MQGQRHPQTTERDSGESFVAVEWTPTAIAAVEYVSVLAAAIAYSAYFELLDTIGAIKTNWSNYIVPVVAAVGGWVLLRETLTVFTLAGFNVIFVGFAVVEYPIPSIQFLNQYDSTSSSRLLAAIDEYEYFTNQLVSYIEAESISVLVREFSEGTLLGW